MFIASSQKQTYTSTLLPPQFWWEVEIICFQTLFYAFKLSVELGMFCTCADAKEVSFFLIGQDFVYGRKYAHTMELSVELERTKFADQGVEMSWIISISGSFCLLRDPSCL